MNFVIICGIFLAHSVHTLLCNPVGSSQFCALPTECLDLWQRQQPNVSIHHTASVVNMLGTQVNICPVTLESHAPYLPVFMVLHIFHTPSPAGSGFSLVQQTSHRKIKTHFILQSLPRFWQATHL